MKSKTATSSPQSKLFRLISEDGIDLTSFYTQNSQNENTFTLKLAEGNRFESSFLFLLLHGTHLLARTKTCRTGLTALWARRLRLYKASQLPPCLIGSKMRRPTKIGEKPSLTFVPWPKPLLILKYGTIYIY